jgi:hypothetical protein
MRLRRRLLPCGSGSSGGRCPSLAHYVTVMEPADRAPAAGACPERANVAYAPGINKLLLYAFAVMHRREAFQLDHDWQGTMARVV